MLNNPPILPSVPSPADHGLLAWSFDNSQAVSTLIVGTAGRLHTVRLPINRPVLVTAIQMSLSTVGATLTAGQNFAMIFDESGNRVGITADMSTLWSASPANLDMTLTAPVQINGPFCHVGFYANGSTLPTFRVSTNATSFVGSANLGSGTYRYGMSTSSLTSTPPSVVGTISSPSFPWWVGLR